MEALGEVGLELMSQIEAVLAVGLTPATAAGTASLTRDPAGFAFS